MARPVLATLLVLGAIVGCAQSSGIGAAGSGSDDAGSGGDGSDGGSGGGSASSGDGGAGASSSTGSTASSTAASGGGGDSTSSSGGGGSSSSTGGGCADPVEDCPATGTLCKTAVCSMGECATSNAAQGSDCDDAGGSVCNSAGVCVPPTCTDGIQNGAETGVDCGGGTCPGCADGGSCAQGVDCLSGTCVATLCVPCGDNDQPCCPGDVCDAAPNSCVENTTTMWGGTAAECNCGILRAGQTLRIDDSRFSCDGRFQLVMQGDGNLVLYYIGVQALWSSDTYGTGASRAVMEPGGSFNVYDDAGGLWFSTFTSGTDTFFAVQDDGNLVIYEGSTPLWASNTVI